MEYPQAVGTILDLLAKAHETYTKRQLLCQTL
jgi:hypothetical protein